MREGGRGYAALSFGGRDRRTLDAIRLALERLPGWGRGRRNRCGDRLGWPVRATARGGGAAWAGRPTIALDAPSPRPRGGEPRLEGAPRGGDPRSPARGRAAARRRPHDRAPAYPGPHRGDAQLRGERRRGLHRRHALQGVGRRRAGTRIDGVRRPEALDHGGADGAAARDEGATGTHRPHDDRRRVGEQRLRAAVAGPRRGERRPVPRRRRVRHARALGTGLRRRPQSLGALGGRARRHRAGQRGDPRGVSVALAADARHALLGGLIDHAALFPPASMSVPDAVAEDRRARESSYAWMVARFVCPASKLAALREKMPWEEAPGLSIVVDGPIEDGSAPIEAVEVKLSEPRPGSAELLRLAQSLRGLAREVYFELLPGERWRDSVPTAVGAVAAVGGSEAALRGRGRSPGRS